MHWKGDCMTVVFTRSRSIFVISYQTVLFFDDRWANDCRKATQDKTSRCTSITAVVEGNAVERLFTKYFAGGTAFPLTLNLNLYLACSLLSSRAKFSKCILLSSCISTLHHLTLNPVFYQLISPASALLQEKKSASSSRSHPTLSVISILYLLLF